MMAVNRFVLNNISYHGAGAIKEIPGEIKRRGYKKHSFARILTWSALVLPLKSPMSLIMKGLPGRCMTV